MSARSCAHSQLFPLLEHGRRDLEYFADGIKNVDVLLVIVQENDVTGG